MTRRSRRSSRRGLVTRAPRKGTLITACGLYVIGLLGVAGWLDAADWVPTFALIAAGGLLILGAFLRDL